MDHKLQSICMPASRFRWHYLIRGRKEQGIYLNFKIVLVTECQIKVKFLKEESSWFTSFNVHREGCAEHIISVTGWRGQHVSSVALERGWIWHSSDVGTFITFFTDDVDFNCSPGRSPLPQLLRDIETDEAICSEPAVCLAAATSQAWSPHWKSIASIGTIWQIILLWSKKDSWNQWNQRVLEKQSDGLEVCPSIFIYFYAVLSS